MISSDFCDLQLRTEYLIVISYLNFEPNFLYRYQSQDYKSFKLIFDFSPKVIAPTFEFNFYSAQILNNIAPDSCFLTIRYINSFDLYMFQVGFDQESNLQVKNFLYLKYSPNLKSVSVCTLASLISYDKPEINVRIFIKNPSISIVSSTQVKINVLPANGVVNLLVFTTPNGANNVVNININDNKLFNSIIYQFQTNLPNNNSIIAYKILNQDLNLFYIERNFLRFIFPFINLVNSKRSHCLVSFRFYYFIYLNKVVSW